ncbi:DUF2062 domain-containing protein [Niabella terrae]
MDSHILNPTRPFFEQEGICVIIPTYNNAGTVVAVLQEVLQYTDQVIVVNDGSTDDSSRLLEAFNQVTLISYQPNRGKGYALRTGLRRALQAGYRYAITMDSDGQHFASDLPVFLEALRKSGPALIMGARNMDTADNVPAKSSFGNRFSNFWYRLETGIDLPDTQTGYRLYPLEPIRGMRFFTRKYEFEIEIIVRLAWKGVPVKAAPIRVYYPPAEERISHFRPFRDFMRISLVNTVLVIICFFYIWPRNFFRRFTGKNWKRELKRLLLKPGESDIRKANAVAFGGLMGVLPIWGFQLLIGVPLAHLLRLNKTLFILAANISIPPMIPVILFFSYKLGKPFMGSRAVDIHFDKKLTLTKLAQNFEQYLYGSLLLALLVAAGFWLLTFILLKLAARRRSLS